MKNLVDRTINIAPVYLFDPNYNGSLIPQQILTPAVDPNHLPTTRVSAFNTSTGLELRFFMPVLNVPFRLIFAYNPQRAGVLDNTLQPQSAFQFRFAVGSTF